MELSVFGLLASVLVAVFTHRRSRTGNLDRNTEWLAGQDRWSRWRRENEREQRNKRARRVGGPPHTADPPGEPSRP
jgi:hypothetical protein